MNNCVIYKSHYGTTKQYAKWIADATNSPLYERSNIKPSHLMKFDNIIIGGGIYTKGPIGIDIISKNEFAFKDKNIIIFTVGLDDPRNPNNIDKIVKSLKSNFRQYDRIKSFHFRGGIDYHTLNANHIAMMNSKYKLLSQKSNNQLSKDDRDFIKTYNKSVDYCNKLSINPLVEYVNQLNQLNQLK